jgi:threonyl-tRNA synthetase
MAGCFDFLNKVYGVFGFEFHLKLSTRPENYIGELSVWDSAEKVTCFFIFIFNLLQNRN